MMGDNVWELVKAYECPDCGQLVRDMNDACNHICAKAKQQRSLVKE